MTAHSNVHWFRFPLAACLLLAGCGEDEAVQTSAAAPASAAGQPLLFAGQPLFAAAPAAGATSEAAQTGLSETAPVALASASTTGIPTVANLKLVIPETVVVVGDTTADVRVRLSEPADRQIAFRYSTTNGSAVQGTHYTRTAGDLTFRVGEQEKIVSVPVRNLSQVGRSFKLIVSWTQNSPTIQGSTGIISIGTTRSDRTRLPAPAALQPAKAAAGRRLVFSSDFKGPVNPKGGSGVWRTRFNWGRWQGGNNELAPYTDATTDARVNPHPIVDGNRVLRTEKIATTDKKRSFEYSASMLSSHGWYSFKHGYIELRAKVKSEAGVVPAFWLLPDNGEWPPEIDIFEFFNGGGMSSTIHFKGNPRTTKEGVRTAFVSDGNWHTYALDWTPEWLITLVDGKEVHRRRNPFNKPMYIIVNTAVGLMSKGPPNADANWKNDFTLGDIKVYQ